MNTRDRGTASEGEQDPAASSRSGGVEAAKEKIAGFFERASARLRGASSRSHGARERRPRFERGFERGATAREVRRDDRLYASSWERADRDRGTWGSGRDELGSGWGRDRGYVGPDRARSAWEGERGERMRDARGPDVERGYGSGPEIERGYGIEGGDYRDRDDLDRGWGRGR